MWGLGVLKILVVKVEKAVTENTQAENFGSGNVNSSLIQAISFGGKVGDNTWMGPSVPYMQNK